jgi:hypothetical protein
MNVTATITQPVISHPTVVMQSNSFGYSLYQFGCLVNGTTNDTVAFANALAAVASDPVVKVLFMPAGTMLTDAFTVPTGVSIIGQGSSVSNIRSRQSNVDVSNANLGAFCTMSTNSALKSVAIDARYVYAPIVSTGDGITPTYGQKYNDVNLGFAWWGDYALKLLFGGGHSFKNLVLNGCVLGAVFDGGSDYSLYNTFDGFRITGGALGVWIKTGCLGNYIQNLVIDCGIVPALAGAASVGVAVPGVATASQGRGVLVSVGAIQNTLNSISNAAIENTTGDGTALECLGAGCTFINVNRTAGFSAAILSGNQFQTDASGNVRARTFVSHENYSVFNGWLDGKSPDGSITWAALSSAGAVASSPGIWCQSLSQFQGRANGTMIDNINFWIATVGSFTGTVEVRGVDMITAVDSQFYTYSFGGSAQTNVNCAPALLLSSGNNDYAFYIKVTLTKLGSFLSLGNIRVTFSTGGGV